MVIFHSYVSLPEGIDRGTTLEWNKTKSPRVSSQISTAPRAAGRSTFFLWSVVVIIVIYYHHAWLSHHGIHPITIQCHSSSTCGQFGLVLGSPGTHRCPSVPIGTHRSAGLESLLLSRGACSEPVPLHAVFKKIVVEATFIQSIRGCSWFWSIWFCSMTWVHSATHYDTAVFTVSDFLGTPSFDTLVADNVPAITSW